MSVFYSSHTIKGSGADGQGYTITIIRSPNGTLVSGSTYDYPILSSVNLTCVVNSSPSPSGITYRWNTTGCFTNEKHRDSTCFPTGQITQSVIGNNLLAEDAGTISCIVTINDTNYTSDPLTLRISGTCIVCMQVLVNCCYACMTLHVPNPVLFCDRIKSVDYLPLMHTLCYNNN